MVKYLQFASITHWFSHAHIHICTSRPEQNWTEQNRTHSDTLTFINEMQTQSYTDTNSYTNYTLNIAISITFPINNCNDWMRNKIFKTYESITAAKSGWDSGQMRRIIGSVALSLSLFPSFSCSISQFMFMFGLTILSLNTSAHTVCALFWLWFVFQNSVFISCICIYITNNTIQHIYIYTVAYIYNAMYDEWVWVKERVFGGSWLRFVSCWFEAQDVNLDFRYCGNNRLKIDKIRNIKQLG